MLVFFDSLSEQIERRIDVAPDQTPQFVHLQPGRILAAIVAESGRHRLAAKVLPMVPIPHRQRRENGVVTAEINGVVGIAGGDHFLVELLAWPDADHHSVTGRRDGFSQSQNAIGWNFGNEQVRKLEK